MPKAKILITGSNGQLGHCLRDLAPDFPENDFLFADRTTLDLEDYEAVNEFLFERNPDVVINAAAYTAVDKAESEQDLANSINGYAVGNLAQCCSMLGIKLVHVSTDYVFAGTANRPYTEDHLVDPVNAYGASKLLGEQLALMNHSAGTAIVRTSWVYSRHGNNFVKTMLRLMKDRSEIKVVADQFGSPTYAPDLADTLLNIALAKEFVPGVYHYSNEGIINWHQFAEAIRELSGFNCNVLPITTAEYPTPAKRPRYSAMDCNTIKDDYGIDLRSWKDGLVECLHLLSSPTA